ncbi:MAG: hypothetical protein IT307_20425 [Chloroflexi bacterium]|nr:hypothetical protein [Chloroflexota bacterium]
MSVEARAGFKLVRIADQQWTDRTNVDGWLAKWALYFNEDGLAVRLVEWPVGSTEPLHVHAGTHATTVLKGPVEVDGFALKQWDIVLGPGDIPHGPLHFPQGAFVVSALQGDAGNHRHSEIDPKTATAVRSAVLSSETPWETSSSGGCQERVLIDNVLGRLRCEGLKLPAGSSLPAQTPETLRGALIVEGSAVIGDEKLGAWDVFWGPKGAAQPEVFFPEDTSLLVWTLR